MMSEIKVRVILGLSETYDISKAIQQLPPIYPNSPESSYDLVLNLLNMIQFSSMQHEMTNSHSLYFSSILGKFQREMVTHFLSQLNLKQLPLNLLSFKEYIETHIFQERFLSTIDFQTSSSTSITSNQPSLQSLSGSKPSITQDEHNEHFETETITASNTDTTDTNPEVTCLMCQDVHNFAICPQFKALSRSDRRKWASKSKVCILCLQVSNHRASKCPLKDTTDCHICHSPHDSVFHVFKSKESQAKSKPNRPKAN